MKVAVIDDDKSVRSSLTRLIKTAGIEVVSFRQRTNSLTTRASIKLIAP